MSDLIAEFDVNRRLACHPIPHAFSRTLRERALIAADAPLPAGST